MPMVFSCLGSAALAQSVLVTGVVTDADSREPMIGAIVTVEGTNRGVVTGVQGEYAINASPDDVLSFQMLGYPTLTQDVGTRTVINVAMATAANELDEMVVIGYGTVRKSELTAAVSTVGEKAIAKTPVTSIDQALQGNAAGVLVINTSAEPGGEVTIRIRGGSSVSGDNEPLIVIDNFPADKEALTLLNPNDVKSMEVLKDAAATAIFGSRGANGVIMVTTKSGAVGAPTLSVDVKQGVQTPRRYLPMLSGSDFLRYSQASRLAHGENWYTTSYMPDTLGTWNAQKMVFNDMAHRGEYSVQVSGGSKVTTYYASGSYLHEQGLINNSSNDRISGRMKFNINMSDKLRLLLSASVTQQTTKQITGGEDGAVLRTLMMNPIDNKVGEFVDGMFVDPETGEVLSVNTELAVAMQSNKERKTFTSDVMGEFQWLINDKFTFTSNGVFKFTETNHYAYMPRSIFLKREDIDRRSTASRENRPWNKWVNENVLNYNNKFGLHSVNAILGLSWERTRSDRFKTQVYGFDSDYYKWDNLSASTLLSPTTSTSSFESNMLNSFFTRVIYNWNQKYHAMISFRADGSSRFGKDKKYGYFPAASFAWNVMNEDFAANWSAVSSLRLRLSYGVTGNQNIPNYQSPSRLISDQVVINGTSYGAVRTNTFGNPNLQWETTATYNAGVDMNLWNGVISVALDAYLKKTSNLLYSFRIPSTSGYSTVMRNVGNVDNKGIEVELSTRNISNRDFRWTTDFNMGFNNSKVTDLGGNDNIVLYHMGGDINSDITYLIVGQPLGTILAHQTSIYRNWEEIYSDDAIWVEDPKNIATVPGMIRYYDRNGDGQIDDDDRVNMGQVQPYLMGGLTNTFTLKNWDLTLFFNYAYGNKIVNANTRNIDRWQGGNYNQTTKAFESYRVVDFYKGEMGNTINASYPLPVANVNSRQYMTLFNDYYIYDGSYLRLKTVMIGYTFPEKICASMGLKNLRVAFSGINLLTFTKYPGLDPEMSSSLGSSNSTLGIDLSSYPAAKMYQLNLSASF